MRPRSPRRPWWALAAVTSGGLWLLFIGCLYVTGYSATVTATGGVGDGFCDVEWIGPSGARLSGESDCYDEPPGSRFQVRVTGWPDAGEPTLTEAYVGMGLLIGLPPFAAGAGRLIQLARRRREEPMVHLATAPVPEDAPGALADERTAAAVGRRRRRAWGLVGLGASGSCAVILLLAVEVEADEDLRADGVTTVGTVLRVDADTGWSAGGASVRFTADGSTRVREVSLGGYADDYVEGQIVDVVYDPADPDRFIVDDALYGFDWTGWALIPALVVAFLAGPVGVARVSAAADIRRLLATRSWAHVRVAATSDGDRLLFTTRGGTTWRTGRRLVSATIGLDPQNPFEQEQPGGYPTGRRTLWWVSDGSSAVFSADRGSPLVLTRRR